MLRRTLLRRRILRHSLVEASAAKTGPTVIPLEVLFVVIVAIIVATIAIVRHVDDVVGILAHRPAFAALLEADEDGMRQDHAQAPRDQLGQGRHKSQARRQHCRRDDTVQYGTRVG